MPTAIRTRPPPRQWSTKSLDQGVGHLLKVKQEGMDQKEALQKELQVRFHLLCMSEQFEY